MWDIESGSLMQKTYDEVLQGLSPLKAQMFQSPDFEMKVVLRFLMAYIQPEGV